MAQLGKYQDFLERVNDLGFMAFSTIVPGFPSLTVETAEELWHTGDSETDPWRWKDRAAAEKKLAYGCILGGHKGFVSARFYPVFYAAFHPEESMEERWAAGLVSQGTWQIWQLFEEKGLLSISDIRRETGASSKKGGSRTEKALKELQQYYFITVAGNRRRIDRYGRPYGWAINVYDRVEEWAPPEWMEESRHLRREEAKETLLDAGIALGRNISRRELARALGLSKM